MRAFTALFRGLFLSTIRNRRGLFWTFFSPLVFMIVFAFIGNQNPAPARLYVARTHTAGGRWLKAALAGNRAVRLAAEPSLAAALGALRQGRLDAVLKPPATVDPGHPAALDIYLNTANLVTARQTQSLTAALTQALNQRLSGQPPTLVPRFHRINGRNVTYLDFLVPGILALMAMNNSLFGLAALLTRWKEKGVLRRLLATPVQPVTFLGASVVNQLLVGLVSLGIVLGLAVGALGAQEYLPPLALTVILVLGMACFLAIGFFIGGIAQTTEAVMPIVNIIAFPMMFFSGVFFPLSTWPPALRHFIAFLPLTYLVDAARTLMNNGTGWTPAITRDALGLTAWIVVAVLATARTWRWE
ncbi:Transport permease protein (modular protein) [Candidatus Hydrogenisulfobacillus filiaventi]|uniref:Transport permease protein n=1 Tax=Candidatus Hydrogenisulfobacillus filiaventi TaxID=2707344 RepID=A0A6F8ZF76_9FIRM|nr:ABC transporter permease [Bacillota bacterium]CAB1128283.1 Transport permease protein (modular protein) [Candidatus Hydrogenisulfobacillus filiaventi]